MLKKQNRLKNKSAFSATYKNNTYLISESVVLYLGKIKTDENCPTRVGFVVSKKVHKRGVKRNRIKRLMRESLRLVFKENKFDQINKFQSLIFVAREGALDKNFNEINNNILTLLHKTAIKNL